MEIIARYALYPTLKSGRRCRTYQMLVNQLPRRLFTHGGINQEEDVGDEVCVLKALLSSGCWTNIRSNSDSKENSHAT